jgi:hypothetical protein
MRAPRHPRDFLDFVELGGFTDDWHRLRLNDDDLNVLQMTIMSNPGRAPVMKGTGGLRKLRFAPPRWRAGKSGAIRVCYVLFQEFSFVLLVTAFAKKHKDDLLPKDRKAIRKLIARIKQELSEGSLS